MQKEHTTVVDKLKQELAKIYELFPSIKELLWIEKLLQAMKFTKELIEKILEKKPVGYKGEVYSPKYQRYFKTEHAVAEIKQHPTEQHKLELTIDGVSDSNWFSQKYREFQQSIGINIKSKQDKGIKL